MIFVCDDSRIVGSWVPLLPNLDTRAYQAVTSVHLRPYMDNICKLLWPCPVHEVSATPSWASAAKNRLLTKLSSYGAGLSVMAAKVCTPFCSDRRPCVKHHDLLVALLNCADNRSSVRHSTDQLESTVVRYINSGWSKDDDIDDPVELYRFPLVHWASVLGKVTALEWMIHNGT